MLLAEITPFLMVPTKVMTSLGAIVTVLSVQSPQVKMWPEFSLAPETIKVETATVPEIVG